MGASLKPVSDLRQFVWLLRNYSATYRWAVSLLLITSYLAAAFTALFPVLMAAILDLALGKAAAGALDTAPAAAGALSLHNLGAAFFYWARVTAVGDRL